MRVRNTGKREIEEDSDEEDIEAGEGSSGYRQKRARTSSWPPLRNSGASVVPASSQPGGNATAYTSAPWQWMPQ